MQHPSKRLVLFDIDGTILNGGKLWRECFHAGLSQCFPGADLPHVSFSGKTDRQICMEIFSLIQGGTSFPMESPLIDQILNAYLSRLSQAISQGRSAEVELLPGVQRLIEELSENPAIRLGLLTGNVRKGARLKLGTVALDAYFESCVGAFGDDHWDRYCLPPVAVKRALEQHGEMYIGKQVVIIGDTVHDVNCGKAIGVRSIAVGTGRGSHREEIMKAKPDFFFDTLSDTPALLSAILRE